MASASTHQLSNSAPREAVPDQSHMIITPTTVDDVLVIQDFMTSASAPEALRKAPYHVISTDRSRPIVYHSVPTWRKGWKANRTQKSSQREIIEHILGPLAPALIAM